MKKVALKTIEQEKEQILRKELDDLCWDNKEVFTTDIDDVTDFLFDNRYILKKILEKL